MIGMLNEELEAMERALETMRRIADEITCPDAIADKLRLELAISNLEQVLKECEVYFPF